MTPGTFYDEVESSLGRSHRNSGIEADLHVLMGTLGQFRDQRLSVVQLCQRHFNMLTEGIVPSRVQVVQQDVGGSIFGIPIFRAYPEHRCDARYSLNRGKDAVSE